MKKILGLFLLAATALFGVAVNDIKVSQATNGSPPAYADRFVTPVANSLLGFDGSVRPADITLGANLSLVNGVLSATSTGGSVNWGSIGGVLSNQADLVAALAGKQSTLTFSTGLTNTSGTVTVNPAQILTAITNLTTNGFVKTSAGNGTLIIDTSTYLTANQTITLSGDASGSGGTAITVTVTKINGTSLAGLSTGILKNTTSTGVPSIATAGTDFVAPGAVTTSGLTMSTARLLGRSTASTGAIEQIVVGSGLSLSGGTLTATGGGSGTVTTVSVVTANGISGSVANATTTPAITLTLGAVTPTSVNGLTLASQSVGFTIAGGTTSKTLTLSDNATISGTNTGDQTNITGNAGTATALQTARTINGVSFDGTAPITVTADAGTLTGTTLVNTVLTSSLTTVGVITTGVWQGSVVTGTFGGTGVNNGTSLITVGGNLTFVGSSSTTVTVTGTTTVTLPLTGTLATLGNNETFTGIKTFTPTLRTSGSAAYLTVNMPADTSITTTAESIGVNFPAGTRTWATGSVTLQREHVFGANTIAAAAASTFTTAINVDIADPIQGTNATLSNIYSLRAANVLFTGVIKAGSGPTTLTNSTGQVLTAAFAAGSTGSGAVALAGAPTFTSSITVGVQSSATGTILFKGTTSGTVTLSTADAAGTWTMKLPTTAGTNLWFLQTDGSGNTTWAAGSGGGSGTVNSGTATQVAYYPSSTTAVSSTSTLTVSATGRVGISPTALSTGTGAYLTIQAPNDAGMTTGNESIGVNFLTAAVNRQFAGSTGFTTQREFRFQNPTYTFASPTGTIAVASTVEIDGAPGAGTNCTITTAYALNVAAGNTFLGGNITLGSSSCVLSQSSNLLTVLSAGINFTPGGTVFSVASSGQDVVISDSTSNRTWVGPGGTGGGMYVQKTSTTATYKLLTVGTTAQASWEGDVCTGTLSSLAATDSGALTQFFLRTYGGSTWFQSASMVMTTTQAQTESARGSKITFATSANTTITRTVALTIDQDGSVKANMPLAGLGYATGAGGAVTQATSKATGVTLNNVTGAITMNNASLAALTSVSFTLTDSAIAATDTVQVNIKSGGTVGDYMITVNAVAAGSCQITVYNVTAATPLSEALVLNFTVLKGASS